MRYDVLTETYLNLLSSDERRTIYAPMVYELLQNSYKSIGGLKGRGFESPTDMMDNGPFWKLSKRGDTIVAVFMYKNKDGRKRVAMGTDGSSVGKYDLAKMLIDEYLTKRAYAEISGSSLRFHQKILGNDLDRISIPSHVAINKFPPDTVRLIDGEKYDYEHYINGNWMVKRMVGNIEANEIIFWN